MSSIDRRALMSGAAALPVAVLPAVAAAATAPPSMILELGRELDELYKQEPEAFADCWLPMTMRTATPLSIQLGTTRLRVIGWRCISELMGSERRY
jgi:hypothetical protein